MSDYVDIDLSFSAHPITGNLKTVSGLQSIKQSLKNLILLNKYESLDNPDLYTGISGSLFDLITDIEIHSFKTSIETIINNYEPRASLLDVVYRNDMDNNGFFIEVIFKPQNAFINEKIDIFFERIR